MKNNMTASQHVATELSLMISEQQAWTHDINEDHKSAKAAEGERKKQSTRDLDLSKVDKPLLVDSVKIEIKAEVFEFSSDIVTPLPELSEASVIEVLLDGSFSARCSL